MNSPCKGCKERLVGCHDGCERYQDMVKEKEKIRKNRTLSGLKRTAWLVSHSVSKLFRRKNRDG